MSVTVIHAKDATESSWDDFNDGGVKALNYQFPEDDKSVVIAELTGHHGRYDSGKKPYYYYILEGEGIFETDSEKIEVKRGDVVQFPPNTIYDYYPTGETPLKVVLFMQNMWKQ